jgi:acyl-CoA dehydrogenase
MTRFAFTPPELPSGLEDLRQEVRAFLAEERAAGRYRPRCSSWMAFDPAFSRRCGERGYVGMTFPKDYGGHGRSFFERYVVSEEMLAAGAPVSAHWIADRQSGPQILRHGCEALRREVVPGIARGEVFCVIGMSEPDSGSDLASARSRGDKVDGGWRLNGRKIWTTNGHRAHYMIGLFRTSPRDEKNRQAGLTQFVVNLEWEGVTRRPLVDMTGEAEFSEITFDNVFVPDSHVLGEPGDGWNLVTGELSYERSGPERFLSTLPLLAASIEGMAASGRDAARMEVGRMVARVSALRQMSLAIAGQLQAGKLPALEAAVVKDMGNEFERASPSLLRRVDSRLPDPNIAGYQQLLAEAMLQAPSVTLRGGTPEILKGVIARGLGLR